MTVDELTLKLKIDQSQVDPELQSFLNKVVKAMDGTKKSFADAGSGGREFHKVLQGIGDESPLLGIALKMAINPIIGLLATAAFAFQQFRTQQKEAAEEAKKSAKETREAWVEANEAIYSKDPKKAFAELAKRRAKEAYKGEDKSEDETAVGQAAKVAIIGWGVELAKYWFPDRFEKRLDEIQKTRQAAGRGIATGSFRRGANVETKEEAKEIRTIQQQIAHDELESQRALMDAQQKLISIETEKLKLKREIESTDKEDVELWKKAQELGRLDHEAALTAKEIAKEQEAAEKRRLEKKKEAQRLEKEMGDIRRMMTAQQFAEYQPTIQELASSPVAWRFNPMAARQARYIEWLQAGAHFQELTGNVAGARETIFGKGGVNELRKQLEGFGLIKPELSLERIQIHLANLDQKSSQGGFRVTVDNED